MSSEVQQSDLTGLRCLLVEDVGILANTERRLLRRLGAEIAVAASVEEAHRMLATQAFDLAIVDIGLPDGDGADVVRTALGITPPLAVLVVSGLRDRAKNLELQAMGAVVMDKGALAEHLPHAVRAALRRRPLRAVDPMSSARFALSNRPAPANCTQPMENVAASFADVAVGRFAAAHRLSGREQEVFALSFQGLGDKCIGRVLEISHSTVRAHWRHIATKTGCEGQREVLRKFAHHLAVALQSAEASQDSQSRPTESAAAAPVVTKP